MKNLLIVCLLATGLCSYSQNLYFPPAAGGNWETLSPDSLHFCQAKIDSLYQFLDDQSSKSFILLKDGKIVLEKYFNNFGKDSLWVWFSAGKSLRSVLMGIAQENGYLDINDKTSDYLDTGWTSLPREKEDSITIWHQLTMTSGLDESEFFCTDPSCLTYKADAGTRWVYHNGPYSLTRDVLEAATGQGINIFTQQNIKNKTGMGSGIWIPTGDNTFYWSTTRDAARFGLMVQAKGKWNNTTVLGDTNYILAMTNSSQNLNPAYGYLWWLNGKSSFIPTGENPTSYPGPIAPDAPMDMFTAAGSQGQFISVAPSLGMVLVRLGWSNDSSLAPINMINEIWEYVLDLNCSSTAVAEHLFKNVNVSPNPSSSGVFHINNLPEKSLLVSVFDVSGKLILQHQTEQVSSYKIDLNTGIYILKITAQEATYTQKLAVE